ncbi:hypothetical protein MPER_10214, partial [Moniliophthora perniciosa FA553]
CPPKWQYMYYILGSLTAAWDRILGVKRVSENQTGIKNKHFKIAQAWDSFRDPKVYLGVVAVVGGSFPNGVLGTFSTQIIHEMGFSKIKTTLLKSVSDMVILVSLLLAAYINHKYKNSKFSSMNSIGYVLMVLTAERLIMATVANVIATIGAIIMGYLPSEMNFATSLMMVASNMAGYTHKITSHALIFTGVCWSNFGAPFVVKQNEAPRFPTAMAALVTGYLLTLVAQALLHFYLVWANAHRDKKYGPSDESASCEAGMQDKTEFENKASFRVCLNEYAFG